jgi:hypothetical protein
MDIRTELTGRIRADESHFGGTLPERFAIAWRGYLAGLLEWGVIDPPTHTALSALVPPVDDDPATAILQGRD